MRLIALILFFPFLSFAKSGVYQNVSYTIEPIYGREKVQVDKVSQSVTTEYFYGARATANYKILSLEAEYTRTDRGKILASNPGLSEGYEIERLKLGLFGTYPLLPTTTSIIRGGADAKRTTIYRFVNSSLVKSQKATLVSPYLGVGIEAGLQNLAVSAGATVVFSGLPENFKDNDYQFSLGLKLRI